MVRWERKPWLAAGVLMHLCYFVNAQQQQPGSIRGSVVDKDVDAPLAGAVATIVETGQKAKTTDQGNFVFPQVAPGRYTVIITHDGYLRQVKAGIVVNSGKLIEINAELSGDYMDLEEFLVQDIVGFGNGSEAALLQLRMESAALMDSVGADLISKAGASDAAAALRLVSGASVADGKSAVIRGLPDRYVSSQMNGVRLPSADDDKRAVELDQFPASVIESIQVSKTFTPDQQGDASGGAVNVKLKGVPNEPFYFQLKSQTGANSQVYGRNDFMTYKGGGLNFWGSDDNRVIQTANLGTNWSGAVGTDTGEAPIDSKWSMAIGGRTELSNGLKVGGSVSVFYERDSNFFDNGIDDSYWVTQPGEPLTPHTSQGTPQQGDFKTSLFDVTQGKQTVQWGGLSTFGVESEHHSITLAYLYSRTAEDVATLAEDTRGKAYYYPGYNPNDPFTPGHADASGAPYLRLETLDYTERTADTLQLAGKHKLADGMFGGSQVPELDWTVSQSSASEDQPDTRQFGEQWIPGFSAGSLVVPAVHLPYKPAANFTIGNLQRIFQEISEESFQYAVDLKVPFESVTEKKGYCKIGIFEDRVNRSFNQDTFSNFNDNSTYNGPFDQHWSSVFPSQNHPITASNFDVDYTGDQKISAAYAMVDMPVAESVTLIGGFRFENTVINIINEPESGATWFPPGSLAPTQLNQGDADVHFAEGRVLPSLGVIYKPVEHLTLRAAYSETLARQTFKELTPILQQEYLGGPIFIGNKDLLMSDLRNYDLRADYTPFEGSLFAVSWFAKDIDKPIEYVQQLATFDFTTAVNYPTGQLSGFEFEARQGLGVLWDPLDGLSFGANATLLKSQVDLPESEQAGFNLPNISAPMATRDMTNAPAHIYNAYLSYEVAEWGTQIAAFYTVQGDTLVAGAGQSVGNYVPNVYATQFDTLNVSVSQSLGKYFKLQLQGKNLTNPAIRQVYRSDYTPGDVTKTSYTDGIDYSIGLTFEVHF